MKQRGFAMILVIWVLVLLSLVAAGFNRLVRVETESGSWLSDQVRLRTAASAAISRALLGLSAREPEQRWRADGAPHLFTWDGLPTRISVRQESGKIDLNYASPTLLTGLFQQFDDGADSAALTAALLDWRDRDDDPSPGGAEAPDYLAAGRDYAPANGPLSGVDELSQVLGFDADLVARIRPYVTIYSRQARIDPYSAPLPVILALPDIEPEQARQFVERRDTALATGGTPDFSLLLPATSQINTRATGDLFEIQVEVTKDGMEHKERAIVRLHSQSGDHEILSRSDTDFGNESVSG
jgi:general secretion pathway protein K